MHGPEAAESDPADSQAPRPYLKDFREANKRFKDRQNHYFNRGHHTRDLYSIPDNAQVWIKSEKRPVPGTVLTVVKDNSQSML